MKSRRDILKFGSALAATCVAPGTMLSGSRSTEAARDKDQAEREEHPKFAPPYPLFEAEALENEVQELLTYRARARKVAQSEPRRGISVPLLTWPLSVCLRVPAEQLEIPEPQIHALHCSMLDGYEYPAEAAAALLAKRLKLIPPIAEIMFRTTLRNGKGEIVRPDRVVSPRYVVDVDEPDFSMRVTAIMILDSVEGIWAEWDAKRKESRAVWSLFYKDDIIYSEELQVTPVQLFIRRNAYMLEVMAWNSGAGFLEGSKEVLQTERQKRYEEAT